MRKELENSSKTSWNFDSSPDLHFNFGNHNNIVCKQKIAKLSAGENNDKLFPSRSHGQKFGHSLA